MAHSTLDNASDLGRGAISRYLQLYTLFRNRIEYGEWPVGQRIPTLKELTASFAVSPATVRKALDGLEKEGLIARYRAKGSYVLRKPALNIMTEIETDARGKLILKPNPTLRLIATRLVDKPPLKPHPGEWTKSYRWIRRTYARDGVPFYVDDVYIDASLARHATRADFGRKTARELLNQVLPPQPIRRLQTLTIRSADFETAGLLQVPLNAPVLLAERTRIDRAGRILMVGRGTYRAEAVRLDYQDEELHTRQ